MSLSLSLAQDRKSSGILPTGSGLGGFHRDFEGTYGVRNGVFDNSFIVVAFAVRMVRNFARPQKWLTVHVPQLSDSGGDSGGFVCFPGSHKSQFPLPPNFRTRRSVLPPGAVSPPIKAGSVILFTVSAQQELPSNQVPASGVAGHRKL